MATGAVAAVAAAGRRARTSRRTGPFWSESRFGSLWHRDTAQAAYRIHGRHACWFGDSAGGYRPSLALLLAAEPDLLLFGGDYVSESPRHITDAAAVLGNGSGATRFGSLAVLGNHDYTNGAGRMTAALEKRGIEVLRNNRRASATIPVRCGSPVSTMRC